MAESTTGRVDASGRLIAGDARLLALQTAAGGALGDLLVVPALAGIARLVQTFGAPVARNAVVAEGDDNFDIDVRARLDGDDVVLVIGNWRARPPRAPWLLAQSDAPAQTAPDPGVWEWATDAALVLTSLSRSGEDFVGQPLTRLVRLLEDGEGDFPILAALAAQTGFAGQRATFREQPDVEIELAAVTVRDSDGAFAGFSGTARGIDARPSADSGLDSDFAERLEAVLRAPLARIVAQADAIREQSDGPLRRDYTDYASDIASAARHLLALVDDLGDLNAVERADFRPDIEDIDIADIARRAAGLLSVRASDRGIRIDRPSSAEMLMARGDFRRVLQILINLIGNAVRYSPDGGMVWLRHEREGDTAVIIVADQGKGIAAGDQARIFEKFERVDPSEPGGSGLGLYIARRLARAMGGDVVVDSAPGQGARFVFTLPAA
ncbi:MAG: sensor histidine kinase [Sphingomonadaceae bacterium]